MLCVAAIKLPARMEPQDEACFNPYLDPERKDRIRRLLKPDDRLRSICGELLTKWMLSSRLQRPILSLTLSRTPSGKPFLPDTACEFNLSHSGLWVAVALGDEAVGIDVERIRVMDEDIVRRFFSSEEVAVFFNAPLEERPALFFDLWTFKESYIKAMGDGLRISLDSFSIRRRGDAVNLVVKGCPNPGWHLRSFPLESEYRCALCSREWSDSTPLRMLNYTELQSAARTGFCERLSLSPGS